jgi:hypothetical protein
MSAFFMFRARRSRARLVRALAVAATVAGGVAACSPSGFLEITDPDVINPSDVSSAAGANAARLGAIARLNTATSGGESLLLLGGLFADEWNNGDSFIARQEIDQRVITPQNNFLTDANRALHRARLSAAQSLDLLQRFAPAAPGWQSAEMYFIESYVENIATEHYCSGVVFSTVVNALEVYGKPLTSVEAYTLALAHADSGLALVRGTTADDVRVRNALQVTKGRILLNLNRSADAATAVSAVPTNFQYQMFHSLITNSNQYWNLNNLAGRYSVSTSEGRNGLNFALAADARVPVCAGGDVACRAIGVTKATRDDLTAPYFVQRTWPLRESSVAIVSGAEARLIEAEAQLRGGNATTALGTLNALRAGASLPALTDAGTEAARVDQLFRERAFTLFGRGTRTGDLRRLIRQYNRSAETVFPTGMWHKGGNYGTQVTIPLPLAELNNPTPGAGQCIDEKA